MKPARHVGLDHIDEGRLKVREQDEWIWNRRLERYEPLAQAVYSGPDPKKIYAKKLRMVPPGKSMTRTWRPDSRIYIGRFLPGTRRQGQPGRAQRPRRADRERDRR